MYRTPCTVLDNAHSNQMPCVCLMGGSVWRPAEFLLGTLPHADKVADKRVAMLITARGATASRQLEDFHNSPLVLYLQRKMATLNRYVSSSSYHSSVITSSDMEYWIVRIYEYVRVQFRLCLSTDLACIRSDVPSCEQRVLHWAIALDQDVGFFAAASTSPTDSSTSARNASLKNDFGTRLRLFLQVTCNIHSICDTC